MFDSDLLSQLREVFSSLASDIEFHVAQSSHADQEQLMDMLRSISSTSPRLALKASYESSVYPQFKIFKDGKPTGITFSGIPGGHEFTSLIVAILNTDGKGKLPEEVLQSRIRALKGPIRLKTYISLTCENCPDVVQALNQMALIHDDFQHEMIDGGYVQEEIKSLGIQGVPSVVLNGKMIHSGRIALLDLITKLEQTFGTQESAEVRQSQDLGLFDVVVVGGGPAGTSAAIYSVRKGLKTALLAEKFGGQVQETKGIENLISVPYTEGPELVARLHKHIQEYPIQVFEHRRVTQVSKEEGPKTLQLEDGDTIRAESVIVATGAKWKHLNIPGEKEYLGRGIAFCPHCDGPFYKGKKVAVIGGGNSGVEAAIDLAGIVGEVVLFEFNDSLKADRILVERLKSLPNTSIVTNARTQEFVGNGEKVTTLRYEDRKTSESKELSIDGVFIQIGLLPSSQFLKGTVDLTQFGEVIVDHKGRTSVKGIYAAGDVTSVPYKQIIISMGEGAKAALASFEDRLFK